MGSVRLRRFAESDQQRLGSLLAKAKEGVASNSEEEELLRLLKLASRISETNARTLAELRSADTPSKASAKKPSRIAKAKS